MLQIIKIFVGFALFILSNYLSSCLVPFYDVRVKICSVLPFCLVGGLYFCLCYWYLFTYAGGHTWWRSVTRLMLLVSNFRGSARRVRTPLDPPLAYSFGAPQVSASVALLVVCVFYGALFLVLFLWPVYFIILDLRLLVTTSVPSNLFHWSELIRHCSHVSVVD
jgi:hypothetical protein